jgi:P-type Cu2+ transporter
MAPRMTASHGGWCRHCLLPVGPRALERVVNGESCTFCCYGCLIAFQVRSGKSEEWEAAWLLIRLGVGGFLSMNIMLFSLLIYGGVFTGADARMLPFVHLLLFALATPAVVILGGPFARETVAEAARARLTSSALIVLGVGAAYVYSVLAIIQGSAQVYFDTATMVLMLFTLGRYLEAAGRARAARDLEPLLAAERESVMVLDQGVETRRPVRELAAGMRVRVRPGERICVDGAVVEGASHADEAVMTGESRPVPKTMGSAVIAGSINLEGPLLIRSSGAGNATRWAQICRSVRSALMRRGPFQRLADRAVALAVPLVLMLGVGTAACWAQRLPIDRALLMGIAVLVVACPCAVGLAAPLATTLGIGRLARHGCLVRDPGALEALAHVQLLAFDKTGTLTSGRPQIVAVETDGVSSDDALARCAGLERHSEHGFGRAVVTAAAGRHVVPMPATDVRAVPGLGIVGRIEAAQAAAGNRTLFRDLGWAISVELASRGQQAEGSGHSVIYVGWADRVRAVLSLDDLPVAEARTTVEALRRRGLALMLLSGDLAAAANRVASALGIADVRSGVSPDDKQVALDVHRRSGEVVAMIGDGLNDGPVLAGADVGIAVGSATDLARETASVVLPAGGLWLLPWVIDVARAVASTVRTNLIWAFGYNLVALTLAAIGVLQPIIAAAVMAGSSLLVVLNSLRLERLPDPHRMATPPQADAEDQWLASATRALPGAAVALAFAALLMLGSNPSAAAEGERGAMLASACASCHRLDGRDKGIPSIVGRDAETIMALMRSFRSGERQSQIMHAVAIAFTDEEIATVARYLAGRRKEAGLP